MTEFGQGDRVRVDIPDETDPDHERFHGQHGIILMKISDDAGSLTNDDRDSVVYQVELDADSFSKVPKEPGLYRVRHRNEDREHLEYIGESSDTRRRIKSRALDAAGWDFTALRNHDRADEYPGTARGAYVLEGPEEIDVEIPETATATAQAELRSGDDVVVTFDPPVAEEFPSIRLLLPGDPLFDVLVSTTAQANSGEIVFVCGYREKEGSERVVAESRYEETDEATVVLPAVDDGPGDLPEGTSLPSVSEAKETVRDWL